MIVAIHSKKCIFPRNFITVECSLEFLRIMVHEFFGFSVSHCYLKTHTHKHTYTPVRLTHHNLDDYRQFYFVVLNIFSMRLFSFFLSSISFIVRITIVCMLYGQTHVYTICVQYIYNYYQMNCAKDADAPHTI